VPGEPGKRSGEIAFVDPAESGEAAGAVDQDPVADPERGLPDAVEAIIERAMTFDPRRDPLILRRSLMHNLRRQMTGPGCGNTTRGGSRRWAAIGTQPSAAHCPASAARYAPAVAGLAPEPPRNALAGPVWTGGGGL
jgi:hypothetical protein